MARTTKTIHVGPETALTPLLDEAAKEPVILERHGAYFRLEAFGKVEPSEEYDPAAVVAALDSLAGSLSKDEAEEAIRKLYEAREKGSRPLSRP